MPAVVTTSPFALAVSAPNGTPVSLTLGDGSTATGSVSGGSATFTAPLGSVVRGVMVGEGPYFDGSSSGSGDTLNRWTGTPDASTSQEYTSGSGTFTTDPVPTSYRFTGRVSTKDQTFPSIGRSEVPLTLIDELGWGGAMFDTFIDVPGQEILSRNPMALYRLAEAEPSDSAPNGKPLALAGSGAAPTVSSGPVSAASEATGTVFAGGQYLTGNMAGPVGAYLSDGVLIFALVRTTSSGHVISVGDFFGDAFTLSIDSSGRVVAKTTNQFLPSQNMTTTSSATVNDGRAHFVAARWAEDDTLAVFIDRSAPVVTTLPGGWRDHRRANVTVAVGGNRYGATFTGTIANAAVIDRNLSNAVISDLAAAPLTGFQGESAAARLARYNRWAGSPYDVIDAAGAVAQMGHFDTEGKGLTDCIDAVATVEDGIVYVRGDNALVLRSRASLIRPTVVATLPGPAAGNDAVLREGLTLREDPASVINDLTGNGPGGQQRVIDSTSIAAYGRRSPSTVDGPFASDAALASVLNWIVSTESTPQPQIDGLSVRLSQLDDAETVAILSADLGLVIGWNGLPSQAASAAGTGIVVGLSETYTSNDLLWSPEVAPNPGADVWVIGDPVYGQLDSTHRVSY